MKTVFGWLLRGLEFTGLGATHVDLRLIHPPHPDRTVAQWQGPYFVCPSCGANVHTEGNKLVVEPQVSRAYYEEIAVKLRGLLIRLDDRLPGKDVTLIAEFIGANELGLALEQMADVLSEEEQPLSADERADMLALVGAMQMDVRVPRALALCPAR